MISTTDVDNRSLVKMSNKLAEARYRLDLVEQKMFLYLVSKIDPNASDFGIIEFNLKDFADQSGSDIKDLYKRIKVITKKILGLMIEVNENDNKWEVCNISSKCSYDSGKVMFKFNSDMKPLLLELANSNILYHYLDVPIKFQSKHSIKFYLYLKANAFRSSHKNGIYISYEDLRKMLGISESEYKDFKNFRVRVIEVAQNEINSSSDMRFDYEKVLNNGSVIGFRFRVNLLPERKTIEDKVLNEKYTKEFIKEIKVLSGLEFTRFNTKTIIELYEMACMKYKDDPYQYILINYLYALNKESVGHLGGYLKKCVSEDLGSAIKQLNA